MAVLRSKALPHDLAKIEVEGIPTGGEQPKKYRRCCAVTVSCLSRFAQPYRVVCNATIEAFFEGRIDRNDVRAWEELLGRYRRAYQQWFGTLRMECGALFGRSPPEEKPLIFWGPDHGDLWRRSLRHRQTGRPLESNAVWALPLPPASSNFPALDSSRVASKESRLIVLRTRVGDSRSRDSGGEL
jgi:hypothetical protein